MPQQPDLLNNKSVTAGVRVLRNVSITVLVAILLILVFIGVFGAVVHFGDHREVILPKPSGPYPVGRMLFDWADPKREDPYSASIGKNRELMVWVWYPAANLPASKPVEYIPAAWASKLPWRPVTIPGRVRAHAAAGVPVSAAQSIYPVLVFSTGFGNLPSDYTSLMEDIASHGYVVLSITNTYSAPVVRFPDGRVAERLPAASFPRGPSQAIRTAGEQIVDVWAADIHFAIDKLSELNSDPKNQFYGRLDLARVGLFGHSFGGAASSEECSADARCKAAVDIDGRLFGRVLDKGIKQPFLFIFSDWTLRPPWLERTLASVSLQRFRKQQIVLKQQMLDVCRDSTHCWNTHIAGTHHFNFTDLAVLYSPGMRMMGYLGPVSGAKGLAETSSCIRTFFDRMLNGQTSTLPAETASPGCRYQPLGHTAADLNQAFR